MIEDLPSGVLFSDFPTSFKYKLFKNISLALQTLLILFPNH